MIAAYKLVCFCKVLPIFGAWMVVCPNCYYCDVYNDELLCVCAELVWLKSFRL